MARLIACADCGQGIRLVAGFTKLRIVCPGCLTAMPIPAEPAAPPPGATPVQRLRLWMPSYGWWIAGGVFLGGVCGLLALFALHRMRAAPPAVPDNLGWMERGMGRGQAVVPGGQLHAPGALPADELFLPPDAPPVDLDRLTPEADFERVGHLRSILAAAAVSPGTALVSAIDGSVRVIDLPAVRVRKTLRLPRPAFRLVADREGGRLYAATATDALQLTPLGDREFARGDLEAFDLAAFLATPDGGTPGPVATEHLRGQVMCLDVMPGGGVLCLAEWGTGREPGLMRFDADLKLVFRKPVRNWQFTLASPAPDGRSVLGLLAQRPVTFDPADGRRVSEGAVLDPLASPAGLMALADGRFLLLDRRNETALTVFDLPRRRGLRRYTTAVPGRGYLTASPDRRTLALSVSAVTRGRVWLFEADSVRNGVPRLLGRIDATADAFVRGQAEVTDGGEFVFTGAGHVYRRVAPKGRVDGVVPVAPPEDGRR